MEITNDHVSIGKGFGRIRHNQFGWLDGEVVTPHGIVSVYAQGDNENFSMTRLDFAHRGFLYMRTFDKRYTSRGIVTKAKQFAKDYHIR